MAINMEEFTKAIDPGLKSNKDHTRFFYRFKIGKTAKRGIIDYTNKAWDKKERIKQAKAEKIRAFERAQERSVLSKVTQIINVGRSPTLNNVADMYFSLSASATPWTAERRTLYDLYCNNENHKDNKKKGYSRNFPQFNTLGKTKLDDLLLMHLDTLKRSMEQKGYSKQTENGCSTRTIKKLFVQTISPILKYAEANKLIRNHPTVEFEKQKRKKKKITDGTEKLVTLYRTITNLYADDPFYMALFLFALYGRRWGEIKTLRWSEINLRDNTYTVIEEHNKIDENQTYDLPPMIATALMKIPNNRNGLVFKSPRTNKELYTPKKQLEKIKEASGIPELTMHLFRHILVTAMGEEGTASTVLSASLGHTNLDTVNDFYLTASHTKASTEANKVIEGIIA